MNKQDTPFIDTAEVQKALSLIVAPENVCEIRILGGQDFRSNRTVTISGYFSNLAQISEALIALRLRMAKGIYVTLNPVNKTLLARSFNKFMEAKDGLSSSDKDIIRRHWLLIDIDPDRSAGISASDEEKTEAFDKIKLVRSFLKEKGWPDPLLADSGNGYHLLYRVDLPPSSDLVSRCLAVLHQHFSDDKVKIDTSVSNPARIVKLYGTMAAKGDNCPEIGRPHRMSKLLEIPEKIGIVPAELLEALAGEKEIPELAVQTKYRTTIDDPHKRPPSKTNSWDQQCVQEFIDEHLNYCNPGPAMPYQDGYKWVLGVCPFNPEHNNKSAVITIRADGVIGFKCHHNGCVNNNWKALRAKFDPRAGVDSHEQAQAAIVDVSGDEDLVYDHGSPLTVNKEGQLSGINQMFVAAKYAKDNLILHDPTLEQFYAYQEETGLWKPMTEAKLKMALGRSIHDILKTNRCERFLNKLTENLTGQILGFLKGVAERSEAFRRDRHIIHVGNGVLHLDCTPPTLNEFSPDYYSRNRSDIKFDETAECPRFLNALLRPALDDDDISLLQRYGGQCLLGRNLSQLILLLRGTSGGGKSTLVNIVEEVIGRHNIAQLRVENLDSRFEMSAFIGKNLLTGKDVSGDFLNQKAVHKLKSLVGKDWLLAEQKNVKHRFDIIGEFNIIITSNTRLHVQLDTDSEAWRRRLVIIDYRQPPPMKPIPDFDRKLLKEEGPGILNFFITGAIRLLYEMDTYGKFQLTPAQSKRVDDLLFESDSVRQFVREEVVGDQEANVTVSELQTAYQTFCEKRGWEAVTVKQFQNQIDNVMMEFHRATKRTDIKRSEKNQRGFSNVTLRNAEQE